MKFSVILPIFKDTNILELDYFVDQNNIRYNDFNSLLLNSDVESYFFYYANFVCQEFEKWLLNEKIDNKTREITYTGNPKTNFIAFNIRKESYAGLPNFISARGKYIDKKFHFYNIEKFIRNIEHFNISHKRILKDYAILEQIFILANDTVPSSLAGLARKLIFEISMFQRDYRDPYLLEIPNAYIGGQYYLKDAKQYEVAYDYDISSMYPWLLLNEEYPLIPGNPDYMEMPELVEGFNDSTKLRFHHIKQLKATLKPQHFPTIFVQDNLRTALKGHGLITDNVINIYGIKDLNGWITSIDYEMLLRDYDIEKIKIDKTYLIHRTVKGDKYFKNFKKYYDLKQSTFNEERDMYKIILDSYSGSLGMRNQSFYRTNSVQENGKHFWTKKKEITLSPMDIAAFMTAYGRKYITELALSAGFEYIISIDTDGIFCKERNAYLDSICGTGLGSLRLDKIMIKPMWFGQKQYVSYELKDDKTLELTPHIAGLPAWIYRNGESYFERPILSRNKDGKWTKLTQTFTLPQIYYGLTDAEVKELTKRNY